METNALMGKNIARLIVDKLIQRYPRQESGEEEEELWAVQKPLRIECDRGRGERNMENGEILKTRPVEPVMEDL